VQCIKEMVCVMRAGGAERAGNGPMPWERHGRRFGRSFDRGLQANRKALLQSRWKAASSGTKRVRLGA
jgi:hypothetical protein